jgi:transcriptional regulator with XRE-family HTH domain
MVGEKIKQLLDNQVVMTRHEVAEKMGMSENNLYKLYKKTTVNSKYLQELCKIFNIDMSYFFNEEIISPEKITVTPNTIKKDTVNNDSSLIEELRATIDKASHYIARLEKNEEFLQDLVKQQFQMLNTKLDKLGKGSQVRGSQTKGNNVRNNVFSLFGEEKLKTA